MGHFRGSQPAGKLERAPQGTVMLTLEQDLIFSKVLKRVLREKGAMLEEKKNHLKTGMWISSRVVT